MYWKHIILSCLAITILSSCEPTTNEKNISKDESTENMNDNPFSQDSELPYNAPNFKKITNAHFLPAFTAGMREQNEVVETIIGNAEKPTFENTILELEKSNELLSRVGNVFFALTSAHTNDEIKAIQEEISPKLSEQTDGIYLNEQLFDRVKTLYVNRESLDLDSESFALLKNYYEDFVKAGAELSAEKKSELKEINSKIASLSTEFNQTLLEANNEGAVYVFDVKELEGLSDAQLESLKTDDTYKLALKNTTQQPLCTNLANRAIREQLFKASTSRATEGNTATLDIVKQLATLRAEKAELLGYANYAEWNLIGTMVKEPQTVKDMFNNLVPAATEKAKVEAGEIQEMITTMGGDFELASWDWQYYAEKVRKAKYDLDEEQIKPYFELKNVLENGVFFAAEKLYGITFIERTKDFPTYHEEVLVYELFEENGTKLGLFYGDYFARDSKRGGAWMSNFVNQSKLYDKKPVVYNVMNVQKPAKGDAALMTYDEVETMFHEMGHALHGLFADQTYPSISGTSVARDFVEFPSQVNENWALHPEILNNYAKHHQTGETIPKALVEKINNASTFNQGFELIESLAAANLDMEWHTVSGDSQIEDVMTFENNALAKTKLNQIPAIPPRYKSQYFAHIWGSGYAAGYYAYLWTEMLSHDAYQWFEENESLTRENGDRFREMILSQGDTQDYETMYNNWRGQEPSVTPMEKARGLK